MTGTMRRDGQGPRNVRERIATSTAASGSIHKTRRRAAATPGCSRCDERLGAAGVELDASHQDTNGG